MEYQLSIDPRGDYRMRRYPGPGWPCLHIPQYRLVGGGCCHHGCKIAWLRAQGLTGLADRLEANATARDWLGNWGKMLYDPRVHGRHEKRRKMAAMMVRAIRNGETDSAGIVRAGAWLGAVMQ